SGAPRGCAAAPAGGSNWRTPFRPGSWMVAESFGGLPPSAACGGHFPLGERCCERRKTHGLLAGHEMSGAGNGGSRPVSWRRGPPRGMLEQKGDGVMDQKKIGAFLKAL